MFIILQNHFYPEVIAIKHHNFAFIITKSTNLPLSCTCAFASNALIAAYSFLQVFEVFHGYDIGVIEVPLKQWYLRSDTRVYK